MLTEQQKQELRLKYNIGGQDTPMGNQMGGATGTAPALESLKKYAPKTQEISFDSEVVGEKPKKGFFSRVFEDFKERGADIKETFGQFQRGEITGPEAGLQTVGQVAGGVSDVIGQGLVSVYKALPDVVEEKIGEAGTALLNTESGKKALTALQGGMESYAAWKQENPRFAENLEAVVNIAELVPIGKVGTVGAKSALKPIAPVAGKAGRGLVESAEQGLKAERRSILEDLVRPLQTKAVKEEQALRSKESSGLFKKTEIKPSAQEERMIKYLEEIPDIEKKGTFQSKLTTVQDEIEKEAVNIENQLLKNNFLIPRRETMSRLNTAKRNLSESPLIVGDAEKIAQKLLTKFEQILEKHPGNAKGLLDARKEYDRWVLSQKPKAFDANAENAFTIANREIRNVANDLLDEKAARVGIEFKQSLAKQSALYDALDVLATKAGKEADTRFGRLLQRTSDALGTKNRAVQLIAAAVGIGGLGAAATFAPAASVLGATGLIGYQLKKAITSPKLRKAIGEALIEIEKKLNKTKDPMKVGELQALKSELTDTLEELPKGKAVTPSAKKGIDTTKKSLKKGRIKGWVDSVDKVLSSLKGDRSIHVFGTPNKDAVAKAKEAFDIDISNFHHAIDNSGVNHALKHTGNQKVTIEDIKKYYQDIIDNPTDITPSYTKIGLPALTYTKKYPDGTIFVVEEILSGWERLIFKNMYRH